MNSDFVNKKVIVLGAGREVLTFLKLLKDDVNIVAFGADSLNVANAHDSITFCKENNIPVISHYKEADKYQPDFIYMCSYPLLISKEYLEKYIFINTHNTLLPSYRGMHGNTWAVINGEPFHGYTIHRVDEGIDSGPIYFQERIIMNTEDDIFSIREKTFEYFSKSIKEVFLRIASGKLPAIEQDHSLATYVGKRLPADGYINWEKSTWQIFNLIRAVVPPYTQGAFTYYKGKKVHIAKAELYKCPDYIGNPGQVVAKLNGSVLVKTGDGALLINRIIIDEIAYDAVSYFKTVGARFTATP